MAGQPLHGLEVHLQTGKCKEKCFKVFVPTVQRGQTVGDLALAHRWVSRVGRGGGNPVSRGSEFPQSPAEALRLRSHWWFELCIKFVSAAHPLWCLSGALHLGSCGGSWPLDLPSCVILLLFFPYKLHVYNLLFSIQDIQWAPPALIPPFPVEAEHSFSPARACAAFLVAEVLKVPAAHFHTPGGNKSSWLGWHGSHWAFWSPAGHPKAARTSEFLHRLLFSD